MPHPKGKRSLTLSVPIEYKSGGAEFKKEIDEFFTYMMVNARGTAMKYPKIQKIAELLSTW